MSKYDYATKTNIGKVRLANEDQSMAVYNPANEHVLIAVCDGMGGQNRGDYAAKLAIDALEESFRLGGFKYRTSPKNWLKKQIRNINSIVFDFGDNHEEYLGMGTTLVAILLQKDKYYVANVGDSRAYISSPNGIRQLTIDQTYVEFLYKTGQISKNEMETHPKRHILMNAIGSFPSVNIDLVIGDYHDETLMVCSDGLYNSVSEREIWSILELKVPAKNKIDLLIEIANQNGGPDNIAISILQKGTEL